MGTSYRLKPELHTKGRLKALISRMAARQRGPI